MCVLHWIELLYLFTQCWFIYDSQWAKQAFYANLNYGKKNENMWSRSKFSIYIFHSHNWKRSCTHTQKCHSTNSSNSAAQECAIWCSDHEHSLWNNFSISKMHESMNCIFIWIKLRIRFMNNSLVAFGYVKDVHSILISSNVRLWYEIRLIPRTFFSTTMIRLFGNESIYRSD